MEYKYSKFLHIYRKEDKVCLYHSLTMDRLYTSSEEYGEAMKVFEQENILENHRLLQEAYAKQMIIDKDYDEEYLLEQIKDAIFDGVNIRVMVLQMTDFCNLKCKYCFIEGGQPENYKREVMSIDTAKAAVDKFFDIIKTRNSHTVSPTVVFYGGEPLLNFKTIESTLQYLEEVEKENEIILDKVIITNGTMMTPEIVQVLKKYNVLVSVSLDGIKYVHDANRIDYDNKGSFDKVVKGIKLLQENGMEPAVSCVMAKEGIPHCEETVRFLVDELKIGGFGFNHVSIIPGLNFYDEEYENQFADAILKVQNLIQKEYPYVYERRMGHKVNTFIDGQLIKSDCTGCGEQMSISPNGEIGICQGYMGSRKTFRHTVFEHDYYPDEDEIFQEWSTRSPLNIEECLKCPALATCGGGCPRNADMLHGSIWNVDSAFCHFARKAQEWLVWQEIEE